jgi:phosphopantetheinyl transferase
MQMEVHPLLSDNDRLRGMWGWCRVLDGFDGEGYLNCRERDAYARLTSPIRSREWLAARMIIKEILVKSSLIASVQDGAVQKDAYGCPRIYIHGKLAGNCHCTITHKNGLALSAVSFEDAILLGVDLEHSTDKPLLLRKAFSTGADSIAGMHDLREKYCILWSCKEAVSKVLGKGMTMDFRKIIISSTLHRTYEVQGHKPYRIIGRYAGGKDHVLSICQLFPAGEPQYEIRFPSFQTASLMHLLDADKDGPGEKNGPQRKSSSYRRSRLFQADTGKVGQKEGVDI